MKQLLYIVTQADRNNFLIGYIHYIPLLNELFIDKPYSYYQYMFSSVLNIAIIVKNEQYQSLMERKNYALTLD